MLPYTENSHQNTMITIHNLAMNTLFYKDNVDIVVETTVYVIIFVRSHGYKYYRNMGDNGAFGVQ